MATLADSRIAAKNGRWYVTPSGVAVPSVTNVLSVIAKGEGFDRWLGNHRSYEDAIAERNAAGDRGTAVHELISEGLATGHLTRPEECDDRTWKLVLGFARWWDNWKPILYANEVFVYTDRYAGTADLVIAQDEDLWLIDVKTSSDVYPTMHYQTAAYAEAWTIMHPEEPITRTGILHLKTTTQKGWQMVESPRPWKFEPLACFDAALTIWHDLNGEAPVLRDEIVMESDVDLFGVK